ncbi:proteoglycan 4-like isoform X3 [Ischnura elegans]|uniref:proteoglycan 4-like isoform X3 n=1 Tax=Ischnura elegans TaxID=197161 RepID=UPI001ED88402|nr:proteoglycan 4-like isoform X3 [Ischnura elegans]
MIGSFWNLCRACPSMPVDKLHSEYRSTYRWHEYTGPRQEVIRRPPQPVAAAAGSGGGGLLLEPALPRKKKHPELAYKTHEFLAMSDGGSDDSLDSTAGLERARPEERRRRLAPARRSKSEGPPPARRLLVQSECRVRYWRCGPGAAHLVGEWAGGGAAHPRPAPHPPPALRKPRAAPAAPAAAPDECHDDEMMTASYPPAAPGHPTRISTEYRLQFAWPREASGRGAAGKRGPAAEAAAAAAAAADGPPPPRKSLSMGAIRPAVHPAHKKRPDHRADDEGASELEPLVGPDSEAGGENLPGDELRGEEKIQLEEALSKEDKFRRRKEYKTEYKKKFRPFSQYEYVEGRFQKKKDGTDNIGTSCGVVGPSPLIEPVPPLIAAAMPTEGSISSHILPLQDGEGNSWYREVLELRRKAGEYKHRGWGTELVPQHIAQLYNKQMALWEQVSRRSSLSALSLASTTPRPISKEEKEKENNKKSSPVKGISSMASNIQPIGTFDPEMDKKKMDKSEEKKDFPRSRKEYLIRHHLERTTGAIDGALLPSPTREKLEPILPRRKDEDMSIKSPPRASPKSSPRSARSHSVGPAAESRSPKRHPRVVSQGSQSSTSPAQGPSAANSHPAASGPKAPSSAAAPSQPERRPRPTSLTTHTSQTRPKSSSVPLRNEESKPHHAMKPKTIPAKSVNGVQTAKLKGDRSKNQEKKDTIMDVTDSQEEKPSEKEEVAPASDVAEPSKPSDGPAEASQVNGEGPWAGEEEGPAAGVHEPLVKSPPEPTRVKSPEQILMRSPEPVNWTVPLDTGKTFTVTQNVLEAMPNVKLYRGELSRPHSETKVWTPPGPSSLPGDIPTSKEQASVVPCDSPAQVDEMPGWKSPDSEPIASSAAPNIDTANRLEDMNEHDAATPEIVEEVKSTPKSSEAETEPLPPPTPATAPGEGRASDEAPPPAEDEEGKAVEDEPRAETEEPTPPPAQQPSSSVGEASASPYRILEAPQCEDSPMKALPPLVSPSSGRSLASDVLEKARTRFDKFWGKGKDSEGKV